MKNKGFTLTELLVTVAVFSLVILTMSSVAIVIVKSQRRILVLQPAQETGRYLLEAIAKDIKLSRINYVSGSNMVLNITNSTGENIGYWFNRGEKRLYKFMDPLSMGSPNFFPLSSSNMDVIGGFSLSGDGARVSIFLKIVSQGDSASEQVEIYLQNTVTSRYYP